MAKIYVASSWRNEHQPPVVQILRDHCHAVYDFRKPPGGTGFAWGTIDSNWKNWTAVQDIRALKNPTAVSGYKSDMKAMEWADACVLVLPCGRSAHLEAGWFAGKASSHGKALYILTRDGEEPELMASMADGIFVSMREILEAIEKRFGEGMKQ